MRVREGVGVGVKGGEDLNIMIYSYSVMMLVESCLA